MQARRTSAARAGRQEGFSLVELAVTVSIAAILMMLAVPNFTWLLNTNRMTAPANEMVASLQIARQEAIRRNARVVLCRSNNVASGAAATCNGTAGSWPGWIVFADTNRNGQRNAGETIIRSGTVTAPLELRVSPSVSNLTNRIVFRSEGLARPTAAGAALSGIVSLCMPDKADVDEREVRLVAGSRVSITRVDGDGTCVAPPDTR